MSPGRKGVFSYKFVEPQLKALKRLGTRLVLDHREYFKKAYRNLLVPPAYYAHLLAFHARYYISEVENSDSGSASGNRSATNFVSTLPSILENVKEVMFYC
ncbi:hypothetical protein KIW84_071961 [Lathyrus oleraceus]|uniref:Uncharacterized protein n=1 Tax=Pisum sativum TaxID=3888 RepID=A0A9D4VKF1_PEA|nr:hypothetical protein KIW84_071961 [Pisum sativum]